MITEDDLISETAENVGLTEIETRNIIDTMLEILTAELTGGSEVELGRFGRMEISGSELTFKPDDSLRSGT